MRLFCVLCALFMALAVNPMLAQDLSASQTVINRDTIKNLQRLASVGETAPATTPQAFLLNDAFHYQSQADDISLVLPLPQPLIWETSEVVTALSPDKRFLAAVLRNPSEDQPAEHMFYVWQITNTPVVRVATLFKGIGMSIAWRPDSHFVAVDRHVFDVEGGVRAFIHTVEFIPTQMSLCGTGEYWGNPDIVWSPDSQRYVAFQYNVCGTEDSGYAIFEAQTGRLLIELSGEVSYPTPFVWSPDGRKISQAHYVWSAANGSTLSQMSDYEQTSYGQPLTYWAQNSRYLIGLMPNFIPARPLSRLYIWDTDDKGRTLFNIPLWQGAEFESTEGDMVTLISGVARITLDLNTGEVIQANEMFSRRASETRNWGSHMAWSPDSQRLLIVSPGPLRPPLWLWERDDLLTNDDPDPLWSRADWFDIERQMETYWPMEFFPFWHSNDQFVTVTRGSAINNFQSADVWNADTGEPVSQLFRSVDDYTPLSALPNAALRQMVMLHEYDSPQLMDRQSGQILRVLSTPDVPIVNWGVWSPSGNWLALYDFMTDDMTPVALWRVNDPDSLPILLPAPGLQGVLWHPSETMIVVGGSLYSLPDGDMLDVLPAALSMSWSLDGQMLMILTSSGLIAWDAERRETITTIPLVEAQSAAWSPDGQLIAIRHHDGHLTLWGIPQ